MTCLADIVVVQERRIECLLDSQSHTLGPFCIARVDDSDTAIAQGRIDVSEVKVDRTGDIHQVGDTTCGIAQRIVGLGEGFGDGEVLVHLDEALVVDDEEGIHTLAHLLDPFEGLEDLRRPLKEEGDRDDTDGQQTRLHGDLADNRGCTRTRTTTHTSGDEDHTRIALDEGITDRLLTLKSSFLSTLRLGASTEPLGDGGADRDLVYHRTAVERLGIGIT